MKYFRKPISPAYGPCKPENQAGRATPLFILAAIIAIAIGLYVQTGSKSSPQTPSFKTTILLPKTKQLGSVNFTDHNNQPFGIEQLRGKWSILFFGFTNCPDICPTTMQTLKMVKQKVSDAGMWEPFQVIMVSVDPERDSIERLKNYVPFFDSEFIGISGDVEHTTEFAKNLGILFFKGKANANGYDVDHGASLILVDAEGEYAGVISAPHKADEISSDLIALSAYIDKNLPAGKSSSTAKKNATAATLSNNITPDTAQSALTITDAWIRPAPPNARSMAAYFKLNNNSKSDIKISETLSPAFHMTMIHETVIEDEVASMRHLEELVIPAGKSVKLTPMGKHIMLMGPKASLAVGDSTEISLIDSTGQHYTHTITVKQPAKN